MQKTALYGIIIAAIVIASSNIGIAFAQIPSTNSSSAGTATNITEPDTTSQIESSNSSTTNQSRLITHVMGQTEITDTPTRIVTLHWPYGESLMVLGIQPVGFTNIERFQQEVELPGEISLSPSAVDVGSWNERNLEAITQLEPDLIIAHKLNRTLE